MKKHIFVSAFIVLTVGCQPTKDGTLLTHYETDLKNSGKHQRDTLVTKIEGADSAKYSQGLNQEGTNSSAELSLEERAAVSAYDAVLRLRMDLAGTTHPTEETELLEKLFKSTEGPGNLPVQNALKSKKIPFSIQLTEEQKNSPDVELSILTQAFKQIAATYGFDEKSQDTIVKAITTRSRMVAPLESQKQMAEASGQVLQEKLNDVIKASLSDRDTYCSKMSAFLSSANNFYGDSQYTLPLLIKNKINYVQSTLSKSKECTQDKEALLSVAEAVAFDLGSLELYLHPRNDFNWQEYDNFRLKAPLKEAVAKSTGSLSAEDILCKKNGEPLKVLEGGQSFDLPVQGAYPFMISKVEGQQGITIAFIAKGVKVTDFRKMSLTKIKPDVLVLAVSLIPRESAEFQFQYLESEHSAATLVSCKVGK
jgi:hypothetical protein